MMNEIDANPANSAMRQMIYRSVVEFPLSRALVEQYTIADMVVGVTGAPSADAQHPDRNCPCVVFDIRLRSQQASSFAFCAAEAASGV